MVVFDSECLQVVHRSGSNRMCLITFSSLGMFSGNVSAADGKIFWGQKLAEKFDLPAYGFVAKQRHWFCVPEMPYACDIVAKHIGKDLSAVAYGSSMGGYGALRWGLRCGAKSTVAFAPQSSISPEVVGGFDSRYFPWFRQELHRDMVPKINEFTRDSVVLFDPSCRPDALHVDLIRNANSGLTSVGLLSCGHECVRAFANSDLSYQLLTSAMRQDGTAIQSLAASARHQAPIRKVELAMRLVSGRKLRTATNIFSRYSSAFELGQAKEFHRALSEIASDSGVSLAATIASTL